VTQLAGTTVLITGAASGIGRLMALECATRGAKVVLWDRDAAGLERMKGEVAARGAHAHCHQVDLADREAIKAAAQRALAEVGTITVLVNNAGVVTGRSLTEASDEDIERTFQVNALASFLTARAFLPRMIAAGDGHVVTISSAGGIAGTARLVDYCASKFAAFGFDESLRLELRRTGAPVRTTVVCPYYVGTGMFEGVASRFPWLLPILDPEVVARRIVRAIERDEARLIMPWFVYVTFLARLLPVSAYDWLADFFGISRSMDRFKGRTPR
jgi:all-trans-retinol dehydrogenase (NAD+)